MRRSDFDLSIKPKPGTANGNADTPSHFPVDDADPNWAPDDMPQYMDLLDISTVSWAAVPNATLCTVTTEAAAATISLSASKLLPPINPVLSPMTR